MRPVTHNDTKEVFVLVEKLWRQVPELAEFPLHYSNRPPPQVKPIELPFAFVLVIPRKESGVAFRLTARHTDESRLKRLRDDLPKLFAAGPFVCDGVPLRGGEWYWTRITEMGPQYATDDGEVVHLLAAQCDWSAPGHWPFGMD